MHREVNINKSMKKLLILSLLLTGCSFIMPVPHDPAEAKGLVDVKYNLENTTCSDRNWKPLMDSAHWFTLYAQFKEDPQVKTVEAFEESLDKARVGSDAYCVATLKLAKTRLQVLESAMKGRGR